MVFNSVLSEFKILDTDQVSQKTNLDRDMDNKM